MIFYLVTIVHIFLAINSINTSPIPNLDRVPDRQIVMNINNTNIKIKCFDNTEYGDKSEKSNVSVANLHSDKKINLQESEDHIQKDYNDFYAAAQDTLPIQWSTWPGGQVPYIINGYFTAAEHAMIINAMTDFHKYTCIRFVPYNGQKVFIRITSTAIGCLSPIGYSGYSYNMNLQTPGCVSIKGIIIHELMHVIGFIHEQSRYDRDNYVVIMWNNIRHGEQNNFYKYENKNMSSFDGSYDFESIMHYSRDAFSINGKETIIPKYYTNINMGQRVGLSRNDIERINKMYKCVNARTFYETKRNLSSQLNNIRIPSNYKLNIRTY